MSNAQSNIYIIVVHKKLLVENIGLYLLKGLIQSIYNEKRQTTIPLAFDRKILIIRRQTAHWPIALILPLNRQNNTIYTCFVIKHFL